VRKRSLDGPRCSGCPEGPLVRSVGGYGPFHSALVIVGEHPGDTECITGRPFTGPSGMLLNQTLKSYGIDPSLCYRDNAVMCSCKPKNTHLDACWPDLRDRITAHQPRIVLTLGTVAFQAVCHSRVPLSETDGTLWWQPELNCWVVPTWHPAAVLRGGAEDKFFPRIADAIFRISRYLSGKDKLPNPKREREHIPWTFFRTPEGAEKALRYYLAQANGAQQLGYAIELACDTESHAPGYGVPPDDLYLPERTMKRLKKSGKGRPHPFSDRWIMLQLYDGQRAAVFDITRCLTDTIRFLLKKLLRHPGVIWLGHNFAQYDTQVFRANGLTPPHDDAIRDTMVWGMGLSERRNAVGLEPLSRTWLNTAAYKKGLKNSGYRHQKGPQDETQWRNLAVYGMDDAVNSWKLNRKLPELVKDEGTYDLCEKLILPLAITCGKLGARGFPINTKQIDRLESLWGDRTEKLMSDLNELAHRSGWPNDPHLGQPEPEQGWGKRRVFTSESEFNPRSHLQLAHLAFDVLGFAPTDGSSARKFSGTAKNLKGRERSVDSDFLFKYADTELSLLMTKLRIFDKLVRTYVRGIAKEIDRDGLVHPDANVAATDTGRLVWKPLLQVLPHYGAHSQLEEEDFAMETRRLFPARPGMFIVSSDYKQLEFRIAWMLSGDAELGRSLMSSDPHATTAAMMFQKAIDTVTKADRHAAKRVGFGVAYNRSAFTLAQGPLLDILGGIEVPQDIRIRKAQAFIDAYWASYPDYRRYFEWCMETALREGELTTPFGRRRRWLLITHENKRGIQNQAVNYPIQSSASDFCSTALIKLSVELPKRKLGYPLYTVHDEIVCEIYQDKLAEGIECIREVMTHPPIATGMAQFPVDSSYGPTLGDLTPYTQAV
jgi:uracil-DNA glycosylase family 4